MTVKAKMQAAAGASQIAAHAAWHRVSRPQARTPEDVPVSLEAINGGWLTAVLCAKQPGAEVTGFEFGGLSVGTTTRRPMTVTYNDAGRRAGLPEQIFVKTTAQLTSRLLVGLIGAVENEARFYERIRPGLEIEAPRGYYLGLRGRSHHSTFLIEDVARTRGAEFLNPHSYIDREMAEGMVGLMAKVHSAHWGDPRLDSEFTWLQTSHQFQTALNDMANFEKRAELGITKSGRIPDALMRRRAEIWPAAMRSLELNARAPYTLLHHDVHSANWYMTADRQMGLYDWQATVKGQAPCDLAYALSCTLTTDDRRAWERALIELYVDALEVPADRRPSFEDIWLGYRQQQFHGLLFWLFTTSQGRFQPETQPLAYSHIHVERITNAIIDLESLDT